MKVGIFCEESQVVCKAFRARGHEAYSVDIVDCSGGHPEWHIKTDVREMIGEYFDLIIFHPVCKYITNSGVRWLHTEPGRWNKLKQAIEFFNLRHKFNSPRVGTENPIPHKYAVDGVLWIGSPVMDEKPYWQRVQGIGKYDQVFQPWHFGHEKMKATCLWLKGLPKLKHTNIVGPPPKDKAERYKWQDVWTASPGPERERLRSVTYSGVGEAMADQWGALLKTETNLYDKQESKSRLADRVGFI